MFINSFLISIAALPGNVWTMVHMDKLGRKFFVVLSMVLSGGCVFFIYLVTSKAANLALSCAFGFVSVMGFNALDCLGIELFPTHLRYHYRCSYGLRTPRESFCFQKSWIFGLGQTFWAEIVWGIWGIFGRTISTHFGTASACFPLFNHYFYKKLSLYILLPNIWIWAVCP